jgi:CheY-like chemotaxis protein/curved DNA-binding protein CbpA
VARVLVVEDDRSVQQLLAEALTAEGFEVACERDGNAAVKAFEAAPADGIILDVLLPGMTGFQVAEKIRSIPAGGKVPIVMLSGIFRGPKHRDAASAKYGLVTYVDKPFRLEDVISPLRSALMAARPVGPVQEPSAASPPPRVSVVRGDLKDRAFPWVLGELFRRRATGTLHLCQGKIRKVVYLRDGAPIAVRSNQPGERLGAVLVRERLLQPSDYDEAARRARAANRPVVAFLLENGMLSRPLFFSALRLQLQTRLGDLFSWESGEAIFRLRERLPSRLPLVELPPVRLIYDGIRRGMSPTHQGRLLAPRLEMRPVLWHEVAKATLDQLSERERTVLGSLDGLSSIRQIMTRYASEDIAALILTAMCAGLIAPAPTPTGAAATPSSAAPGPSETERPAGFTPPPSRAPSASVNGPAPRPAASSSSRQTPAAARQPQKLSEVLRVAELKAHRASLEGKNHWEVLGVDRGADTARIRAAYHQLAKQYHPDRFTIAEAEAREIADQIFAMVSYAHQILTDDERRRKYEAELAAGTAASQAADKLAKVLAAERAFGEGQLSLQRRQYAQAAEGFEQAVRLYEDEAEYHAFLGYALVMAGKTDPTTLSRIEKCLKRAKQLSPENDKAYLFEGYLLKNLGKTQGAASQFRKAMDLNPKNVEAARELRLIAMRSEGGKKRS